MFQSVKLKLIVKFRYQNPNKNNRYTPILELALQALVIIETCCTDLAVIASFTRMKQIVHDL
jgi:hypothetical protein